ncbi:MAG: D-alanine--D-alanine ligase [Planctomycetota bacterium]|nr:MAG: D-alanine--D-alanine ligase [Planctomycetota bacterium]
MGITMKYKLPKIAVFMGGNSREREVSLKSGQAVIHTLQNLGYPVQKYDIQNNLVPFAKYPKKLWPDVVFLALHGGAGENGQVQKELEKLSIPYTGSNSNTCQKAIHKSIAKKYFQKSNLHTPKSLLLSSYWPKKIVLKLVQKELKYPLILKPPQEGSSIGLHIAQNSSEFKQALQHLSQLCNQILVEEYIQGKEFTVAILENQPLPAIEIQTPNKLFDYTAKYTPNTTNYLIHPPSKLTKQLQNAALLAHKSLKCRHFSRVDLIWNYQKIYVLELNTLPGLTQTSLLPKACAAAGISFPQLCTKMISLALQEHKRQKKSA